ncbi:pentatricopeptide repeat-containing protein At3g20730 [Olea europaea var. sylvestris]|uniref:pentatricopeptide repeat-containing protein At3g20730 n=1 Tax=Olea europaea var. sylvestris TaxID=158386 RepID=UPI000C1D1FFD|nr:pentatricopeptide repeat-containing protein At3g20730 [Olea europaea var. sylvestris]
MPPLTSLKSIVESLCDLKKLREALWLILSRPLEKYHYCLSSKVLQLCIELKSRKSGHLIHGHLITNGIPLNTFLITKLIVFYSKIGDMESAGKLFDRMPKRDVVPWTALISGYSQNGDSEKALKIFSAMHKEGVKANQFTYGSALSACTNLMCLERGKQIQGCVQKGRYVENLFVLSALVDLHSKSGKMEDAYRVFQLMEHRDLVSWNTMIGGYVVQGFNEDAFLVFRMMLREGMVPDYFSFGRILSASVGSGGLMKVSLLHGYIIQLGFASHTSLCGSLIDAYVKCGSTTSANQVYKFMQYKDIISCTALITGYAREGTNSIDALELFSDAHRNVGVDDVLLCSMLNICANMASLNLGRQLHAMAMKYQNQHDVAIGNVLIDMYSKSGVLEFARRVFNEMEEKNIISWTSLITGYGKHGYGHQAVALYEKMEDEGLKPNDITFLSLLFACSHSGLIVRGWECFSNMVSKHNILPRAEHYSCLVDLFARTGRLEEAYDLVCKMNAKSNPSLWGTILGACSIHGNVILGEIAGKRLFNMEPENPVNHVVLSSIYAAAGLWDNAGKTRELMEEKSLLKNTGCSLFQSLITNNDLLQTS